MTQTAPIAMGADMGIMLLKDAIDDFELCVHEELLAFVRYPDYDYGSRCFAYPQFLIQNDSLIPLTENAFPDEGCLPMVMASTTSKADMLERFGEVVVMIVNDDHLQDNFNYPDNERSRYNGIIDPSRQRGRSAVEFSRLSKHALSTATIQVIEIEERIDFSNLFEGQVHCYSGTIPPQTKLSLVSQSAGGTEKYYGPFECVIDPNGEIGLRASSQYNKCVAELVATSFKTTFTLRDGEGFKVAKFVDADEFKRKFDSAPNQFDWIGDDELIDVIGRMSRIGEDALTKSKMRALKQELAVCADAQASIALTPQRRKRMIELVSAHENWSSLPDEMKGDAIANADPSEIADFVLTSEYFKAFYDKAMENDQVRSNVEKEKARYAAQVDASKKAAEDAELELEMVKAELEEFDGKLAARKTELEGEVKFATQRAREELDRLQDEIAGLESERDKLLADKVNVQRQIRKTVADMSDELSVSSKILENEMIKQIVASITEPDPLEADTAKEQDSPTFTCGVIRPDESDMDPASVLQEIERAICIDAGREFTRNEIVNLLICLTQGYITTLAGLPGTGKTSLAGILAGALGLTNAASRRFVEVSVEKGWTSYKDLIGYYNPFTKQMEKSNASVFDAFAALDAEVRSGVSLADAAPYLFVLDEANLSSLEHYWSPFLRSCDSFRLGPTELSLGGESALMVPNYVRFIATVNFDHTTEELSPRFLDRSWVITLDPEPLDIESDGLPTLGADFSATSAFSFEKLCAVFGPRDEVTLEANFRSKYKEVMDAMSRHRFPVSPRSQRMILDYVRTACGLMDCGSAQSAYAPIDFAVSQKALPLISGVEERVGELLKELAGIGGLPITKSRVERMLEVGEDSGFYQYFA